MPDTRELADALNRMTDQLETTERNTHDLKESFDHDKSFRRRVNVLAVLGFSVLAILSVMSIDHQFDITRQQAELAMQQRQDRANRCRQLNELRGNIIVGVDAVLDEIGEGLEATDDLQILGKAKLAIREAVPRDSCERSN